MTSPLILTKFVPNMISVWITAFIGLYLVYVAVVIVGRYIYRCQQRREEEDLRAATPSGRNPK